MVLEFLEDGIGAGPKPAAVGAFKHPAVGGARVEVVVVTGSIARAEIQGRSGHC